MHAAGSFGLPRKFACGHAAKDDQEGTLRVRLGDVEPLKHLTDAKGFQSHWVDISDSESLVVRVCSLWFSDLQKRDCLGKPEHSPVLPEFGVAPDSTLSYCIGYPMAFVRTSLLSRNQKAERATTSPRKSLADNVSARLLPDAIRIVQVLGPTDLVDNTSPIYLHSSGAQPNHTNSTTTARQKDLGGPFVTRFAHGFPKIVCGGRGRQIGPRDEEIQLHL